MKNKIVLLILLLFAFIAQTKAQIQDRKAVSPQTAPVVIHCEVLSVVLQEDSIIVSGNGHKAYYKAIITSTGRGVVQYEWVASSTSHQPNTPGPSIVNGSIVLSGTGTDEVLRTVNVSPYNMVKLAFRTVSPNSVGSNTVTY